MKSLEEQISTKCIHFNGVMNECCKAGIKYANVRVDRPYKFPCLKQGGICASSQFLTEDQVKIEVAEITSFGDKSLIAYAAIKDHFEKTKERTGKIKCECGGDIRFIIATVNEHIRAKCSACGIQIVE